MPRLSKPRLLMLALVEVGGFCMQAVPAQAATHTWDIAARYGVTQAGIRSAIEDARDHFSAHPGDTVILHLPAGTYNIGGNGSHGINLSTGMSPGPGGRLILEGEGMELTTLVFTDTEEAQIWGSNVNQMTFRDMHMTRAQYTVSQGTVVEVGANYVDLDIHEGFPMPDQIVRWAAPQGLYLRRYTPSTTDPLIITDGNNQQVRWSTSSYRIAGQRWRMIREAAGEFTHYKLGEYVGIKSKHTGNTYFFVDSNDLVFERMKWTHSTRGVFRMGTSNVRFSDCRIERSPAINGQTPCLSSAAGGPQLGQDGDPVSTNMVIERCYIESTGDDCVGIFHVNGGRVVDCVFRDSFARGILMTEMASNIRISGSTSVSRGPIEGAGDAGVDAIPPAQSTGLSLVDGSGRCRLSWEANEEADLHYYQIYRKLDGVWWEYASTTDTLYDDLWADNGTIHSYYIEAVDTSGNHSAPSPIASEPPDYAMWIAAYGVSGPDALESADPEPDGVVNYMEYALGGNPTLADSAAILPEFGFAAEAGSNWMEFVYRRRIDHVSRGISCLAESSAISPVAGWGTGDVVETGIKQVGDGLFETVTHRIPLEGVSRRFARLRIVP